MCETFERNMPFIIKQNPKGNCHAKKMVRENSVAVRSQENIIQSYRYEHMDIVLGRMTQLQEHRGATSSKPSLNPDVPVCMKIQYRMSLFGFGLGLGV